MPPGSAGTAVGTGNIGSRLGHLGKALLRTLSRLLPVSRATPAEQLQGVGSVLLVRPNFRIGNTLMTTPLVAALRERFPGARIDYLGGDTTIVLLAGLPIDRIYAVSRGFVHRPWRFAGLFYRLRRQRYDVAVEGGMGSFSGALYAYLAGARFRVGCRGTADRLLNVRLEPPRPAHAYDTCVGFARALGAACPDHPIYAVAPAERRGSRETLRAMGLVLDDEILPFLGLFVGGHRDKRWPAAFWIELVRGLDGAGARFAVFLGPEERTLERPLSGAISGAARVVRPRPLREFAALWAEVRLAVTPDSGPMHLAAALERPTIALLQAEASSIYRPRGANDRALARPRVADVVGAVIAHPEWPAIVDAARPGRALLS